MTTIDPSRLVFVGGLHRSGTTPFSRVLDGHPDICGLTGTGVKEDEGQHLQPVYPKAKVYGGSGRFAYAPQAHLTEESPLVSAANAEAMLAAWRPYWREDARLLVEKSPPNIVMGRFLQALYPGSAFVVVVRHPVAVALSNKKWRRFTSSDPRKFQSLSGMVDHWMRAHETLAADLPHLDRVLVVHYERLVSAPQEELARVADFLGLSTPIDHSALSASRGDPYAARWAEYAGPALRPGAVQRRLITRRFGDRMRAYGYDVDDLSAFTPPSGPASLRS
ncbi:sulfotransferase family protein [Lapillicoccus jejuensis]|uniref:Sulfotransferase family protein n=1 Tax=Lapillicoccus jejuensis TaxID=402171 RepID=A0A542E1I2_9MICO|nr:sulfotransferase [Lapillicoccus jejuensis]TQJ09192.1 sulfotransferase family protein [Lapillicoccus jejuensis]